MSRIPTAMTLSTPARYFVMSPSWSLLSTKWSATRDTYVFLDVTQLRCPQVSAPAAGPASSRIGNRLDPTRILVVEDDPDIAELVVRYARKAGYAADHVVSGRD